MFTTPKFLPEELENDEICKIKYIQKKGNLDYLTKVTLEKAFFQHSTHTIEV